jgi:endoglycosylceramidase
VMARQAAKRKAPLFLGEIGCGRSDVGAREAMADQCEILDDLLAAGWAAWEYTPASGPAGPIYQGGMSLVSNGSEHPALDVMVRPYPRALAGEPQRLSYDPKTRVFRVEFTKARPDLETVISLPRRHYPAFDVRCTGTWKHDAATGTLLHRADPAVAVQSIVVTPR